MSNIERDLVKRLRNAGTPEIEVEAYMNTQIKLDKILGVLIELVGENDPGLINKLDMSKIDPVVPMSRVNHHISVDEQILEVLRNSAKSGLKKSEIYERNKKLPKTNLTAYLNSLCSEGILIWKPEESNRRGRKAKVYSLNKED
jgi:hypothetical protein